MVNSYIDNYTTKKQDSNKIIKKQIYFSPVASFQICLVGKFLPLALDKTLWVGVGGGVECGWVGG